MLSFSIEEFLSCISESAADAAVLIWIVLKHFYPMLQVSFFLKGHHGLKSVPRNPTDCTGLDNWVFDNFILVDELFAKALRNLETYVSVNNKLCRNLVWSLNH